MVVVMMMMMMCFQVDGGSPRSCRRRLQRSRLLDDEPAPRRNIAEVRRI